MTSIPLFRACLGQPLVYYLKQQSGLSSPPFEASEKQRQDYNNQMLVCRLGLQTSCELSFRKPLSLLKKHHNVLETIQMSQDMVTKSTFEVGCLNVLEAILTKLPGARETSRR